jgi:hypothetical protein
MREWMVREQEVSETTGRKVFTGWDEVVSAETAEEAEMRVRTKYPHFGIASVKPMTYTTALGNDEK